MFDETFSKEDHIATLGLIANVAVIIQELSLEPFIERLSDKSGMRILAVGALEYQATIRAALDADK